MNGKSLKNGGKKNQVEIHDSDYLIPSGLGCFTQTPWFGN